MKLKPEIKNGKLEYLWFSLNYNQDCNYRIKAVGRRNDNLCTWNPDKKQWKIPAIVIGEFLKAFPDVEMAEALYSHIPNLEQLIAVAKKMDNHFQSMAIRLAYLNAKYSGYYFKDIPAAIDQERVLLQGKIKELGELKYWDANSPVALVSSLQKTINAEIITKIHEVDTTVPEYAHESNLPDIELRGYIKNKLVRLQLNEPPENEKDGDESLLGSAGYRLYQAEDDNQYWAIPVEQGFYDAIYW